MGLSFRPRQWLDKMLGRGALSKSPDQATDDRNDKRPAAQPFFLCPSCGYSREQTPDGRRFCQQCATEFNSEDVAYLPKARSWLNGEIRTLSLKELIELAEDKDSIRRMMRPFFDDLMSSDRVFLKNELDSAGFPGTNTFDMLIHWVNKRLDDRVRRETHTAMYGPPIYVVRGGLPGLGK